MSRIIPPTIADKIFSESGKLTSRGLLFFNELADLSIIEGAGSPEGVVEARIARRYMDTAGVAGSILYIKRDADVLGDKTKGWVLV